MRKFLLAVAVSCAACSNEHQVAKDIAQCDLDADSPAGLAYRKSDAGPDFNRYVKSYDYNLFIIKCMQSKGYKFPSGADALFGRCWTTEKDANGVKNPLVDDPQCYM